MPGKIFYIICSVLAIGIIIGSFYDYRISVALSNKTSIGDFHQHYGNIISHLLYPVAGMCLFKGLRKKGKQMLLRGESMTMKLRSDDAFVEDEGGRGTSANCNYQTILQILSFSDIKKGSHHRVRIGSGDGEDAAPCIYGIKHQGTSKAYRIRIRRMHSNVDGRYFLRISQYPSNETEIFRTNLDPTGTQNSKALSYNGTAVTRWNLQEFDWDHPAGELDFPLQGYIDAGGSSPYWNQIGICTIMRLPEYESNTTGTNWTFYMRNATSGVAVGASSRRALGDCIRLVRDIEATDEED